GDGIDPARQGRHPCYRFFDQPVGDGEEQVVFTGKMAGDRRGIGTERSAELGEAEPVGSLCIEQGQALGENPPRRHASAAQPPVPTSSGSARHHLPCRDPQLVNCAKRGSYSTLATSYKALSEALTTSPGK